MSTTDHTLFYDSTPHFLALAIEYEQYSQPILLKTCQIMCTTNINTKIHEYGQIKAHMIIGYENRCLKWSKKAHLHALFDDTMDANMIFRLALYTWIPIKTVAV